MVLSISVALILGGGAYLFGTYILNIYTSDADVIKCGLEILSITTVPYFFLWNNGSVSGALRGMGYSTIPMILSIIGTVGIGSYGYLCFSLCIDRYIFFLFHILDRG